MRPTEEIRDLIEQVKRRKARYYIDEGIDVMTSHRFALTHLAFELADALEEILDDVESREIED